MPVSQANGSTRDPAADPAAEKAEGLTTIQVAVPLNAQLSDRRFGETRDGCESPARFDRINCRFDSRYPLLRTLNVDSWSWLIDGMYSMSLIRDLMSVIKE